MNRVVGAHFVAFLPAPMRLELQVAVAQAPLAETLSITVEGLPQQVREVVADHGGRLHVLRAGPGRLRVSYDAVVGDQPVRTPVDELDVARYVRPSRYAESDRLVGLAENEFGRLSDPGELLDAVRNWVSDHLVYVLGSSHGTDGAVDTMLSGRGVCRDYAHLTVALLRAQEVPARLASVYAPGLWPMDFHAVAEALVDDAWRVVDPTLLAPRQSLVRIATGRDAADTSWLSSYGGAPELEEVCVTAYVDGLMPTDDPSELVSLE